ALGSMCRTITTNLRPGGRLVTILGNFGPGLPEDTSKYGWTPSDLQTPLEEGLPYRLTFFSGEPNSFEIENYYYAHDTYDAALREAGFHNIRWIPLEVSDEGIRAFGREYWQDFLRIVPIIGLECEKSA